MFRQFDGAGRPVLRSAGMLMLLAMFGASAALGSPQLQSLALEDRLIHVFEPDDHISYIAHLSGIEGSPSSQLELDWSLEGWDGPLEESGGRIQVDDRDWLRISFAPEARGWHRLTVRLLDGDDELDAREATFVVSPRVKSRGQTFRYGLSSFLRARRGTDFVREVELVDRLGIDLQREDWLWRMIQPERDEWDFSKYDIVVNALERIGVEPMPILCYTVDWASTGDLDAENPLEWQRAKPDLEAYVEFVRRTVAHYRGRIRYWQIWNEPDIPFWRDTVQSYARLFQEAGAAVIEANPDARVLNGGFAMVSRDPNPNFIDDFLELAKPEQWDWQVWAYHDYQTFSQMLSRSERTHAYRQRIDMDGPIWVTEGGLNTHGRSERERMQAITLAQKLAYAPAAGIQAYMWFNLRDGASGEFGLTDDRYSPRPAYAAYQVIIEQLADRPFLGSVESSASSPTDVRMLRYGPRKGEPDGKDEHEVLVLWSDEPEIQRPVAISGVEQVESAVDMMGNPAPLVHHEENTFLAISDQPTYVHIRADDRDPRLHALLQIPPGAAVGQRGKPREIPLELTNTTNSLMRVFVDLKTSHPGITVESTSNEWTLKADETQALDARVTVADGETISGARIEGTFRLEQNGTPLPFRVPLVIATEVPRLAPQGGTPILNETVLHLQLTSRDDVVNLYDAEPAPEMAWKGPNDLSAEVGKAYSADALYVTIDVTDDTHHQIRADARLWRHDSVQVAAQSLDAPAASGHLEFGVAKTNEGETGGWIYTTGQGASAEAGPIDQQIDFRIDREPPMTRYALRIPWRVIGPDEVPRNGLRFNMIVNDDDGEGRKQWVQMSDGIGEGKNPELFRVFNFE